MKRENSSSGLPSGYKKIKRLISTGTQYINTGVILEDNFEIKCEFFQDYEESENYANFFGCQNRVSPYAALYFRKAAKADVEKGYGMYQAGIRGDANYYSDDGLFKIQIGKKGNEKHFSINGNSSSVQDATHQYQSAYPVFIFADNNGGTERQFSACENYSFEITNNGNIVRNFIPAIRLSDNKPGLYDLCGSICPLTGSPFYVNNGTGEFLYN